MSQIVFFRFGCFFESIFLNTASSCIRSSSVYSSSSIASPFTYKVNPSVLCFFCEVVFGLACTSAACSVPNGR